MAVVAKLRVVLIALLAVSALAVTGCAPKPPAEPPPPPGPELLAKSADAMAKLKSVAVDVQVDQALTELPIRSANAKMTANGEATGSAVLAFLGTPAEYQFVVTKGMLYLKGATGGFQRLPLSAAASIYDPTALLRPDTGVTALLRTAAGAVNQGSEVVNGVPCWRVWANLDPQVAGKVVPGLTEATSGQVWLDKATSRLIKAQVSLPTAGPNSATAPITVTLSDFDVPVTVTAPAAS